MEQVARMYREDQITSAVEHMATRISRALADQLQGHETVIQAGECRPRKPDQRRRKWTADEDDIVKTLSAADAAQQLGLSEPMICKRRKLLGVGLHHQRQDHA